MKAKLSPYRTAAAAASCAILAACSTASSQAPAATAPATASAACAASLGSLYRQAGGGMGAARFEAAVNAEAYAGTLAPACLSLTPAALKNLAARAAGGR